MKIKKQTLNQSGASALEFALLLPVLLLILFGIIEFSVLFYNKAMITNASREGARFGISYVFDNNGENGEHPSVAQIETVVSNYIGNMLITFGTENIDTDVSDNATGAGDTLRVTVSYDYDFLILPNFADKIANLTLKAHTKMRLE
jgi:Flp pilus assembly protein TadG